MLKCCCNDDNAHPHCRTPRTVAVMCEEMQCVTKCKLEVGNSETLQAQSSSGWCNATHVQEPQNACTQQCLLVVSVGMEQVNTFKHGWTMLDLAQSVYDFLARHLDLAQSLYDFLDQTAFALSPVRFQEVLLAILGLAAAEWLGLQVFQSLLQPA